MAIAISSSSTPPTHLTAGKFRCISRWLASSSNPHWQITSVAPTSWNKNCISTSLKVNLHEDKERNPTSINNNENTKMTPHRKQGQWNRAKTVLKSIIRTPQLKITNAKYPLSGKYKSEKFMDVKNSRSLAWNFSIF